MKDGLIKKSIDASVEEKTKELTKTLKKAWRDIEDLPQAMQHELFMKYPRRAAVTLQVLAEAAARYAVTARVYAAQLKILKCMQEVVNAEQKEDNKEEKA